MKVTYVIYSLPYDHSPLLGGPYASEEEIEKGIEECQEEYRYTVDLDRWKYNVGSACVWLADIAWLNKLRYRRFGAPAQAWVWLFHNLFLFFTEQDRGSGCGEDILFGHNSSHRCAEDVYPVMVRLLAKHYAAVVEELEKEDNEE